MEGKENEDTGICSWSVSAAVIAVIRSIKQAVAIGPIPPKIPSVFIFFSFHNKRIAYCRTNSVCGVAGYRSAAKS
jgi:hypothetical protein